MDIFASAKARVGVREAAERYGVRVDGQMCIRDSGKPLVEGIDKIAHFRAVPDKGALHFRDSYVS